MVYSFPSRPSNFNAWSSVDLLISASLGGAIILHACACELIYSLPPPDVSYDSTSLQPAILAYVASFVLIRYRLSDAEKEEAATERPSTSSDVQHKGHPARFQSSSAATTLFPSEASQWDGYTDLRCLISVHQVPFVHFFLFGLVPKKTRAQADREALATPDDAVARLHAMVTVLTRCHTMIGIMTQLGFMLALLGILAYFWTGLPRVLGIWATALLGGCLFGMGAAII